MRDIYFSPVQTGPSTICSFNILTQALSIEYQDELFQVKIYRRRSSTDISLTSRLSEEITAATFGFHEAKIISNLCDVVEIIPFFLISN